MIARVVVGAAILAAMLDIYVMNATLAWVVLGTLLVWVKRVHEESEMSAPVPARASTPRDRSS